MPEIVSASETSVPRAQFSQLREELLARGKKLQKGAKIYLVCVVGTLFLGLAGIIFAAYLPRFDLQARQTSATQDLIDSKREEINAIVSRLLVPRRSLLLGVGLADNGRAIAVGSNGTILTSANAGATWTNQGSKTAATLNSIALADDGRAIAVGYADTILTTANAGATWIERNSDTEAALGGIALADNGRAIAVGENGTILTTANAGATWIERNSDTEAVLGGIALADDGRAITVGVGIGIISSDSGSTWTKRISSLEEVRAERELLLQEIRNLEVGGVGQADQTPGEPPTASEELMRTGPIRLAIVVLLLFLVQVLVGLNRYNTRLAAFYLARADTLLLLPDRTDPIPLNAAERLTEMLSPDQLDFGKTPKAVAQHAVELMRALSTSRSPQNRQA